MLRPFTHQESCSGNDVPITPHPLLTPQKRASEPIGVDWPLYEGLTCLPPSLDPPNNTTCTLGGMPSYVVNVTNVAQIQLAVNFARSLNLRLSIKNTGHDFNAKSSGGGSLSVWMHHLNDVQYLGAEFTLGEYTGPALKLGAGVEVLQVYEFADSLGLEVVGGIARVRSTAVNSSIRYVELTRFLL